jgi:hypothetical protein
VVTSRLDRKRNDLIDYDFCSHRVISREDNIVRTFPSVERGGRAERRARAQSDGRAARRAALRRSGEGGRRAALRRWRRGDRGRAGGGAKRKCETSEREKAG